MISKRKISALIITLFLSLSAAFATGAGIQAGLKPEVLINQHGKDFNGFSGTISGSLRLSRIPLVVGAGLELGKEGYGLMAFADYWVVDLQVKNTCNFYSGFGFCADVLTKSFKDFSYSAGTRFFAGLNWLFYDNYLEVFAQQNIVPTYKSTNNFIIALPFEAGIRMHF